MSEFTDADLADLEAPKLDSPKPEPVSKPAKPRGRQLFYFDLETIPDESRLHLFDLDPIPEEPDLPEPLPEAGKEQQLPPGDMLDGAISKIEERLAGHTWPPAYLLMLRTAEKESKKPRKGCLDLIDRAKNAAIDFTAATAAAMEEWQQAKEDRRKLLGTTPEYCRICLFAWAIGNDKPESRGPTVINGEGRLFDEDEVGMLKTFWHFIQHHGPLVGFNIVGFDLPVICMRSAILGVTPSRKIDLRPWGNDVIDLMQSRWPKGRAMKLKQWAKLMGVRIPAGDCDGSQVAELMKSNPAKLHEYGESDVTLCQDIHRRGRGLWWA